MDGREQEWLVAIESASEDAELREVESRLFGKKGEVLALVKGVSSLPKDERPAAGKAANLLKRKLEAALDARKKVVRESTLAAALAAPDFDPTEPGPDIVRGSLHPVSLIRDNLVDLFSSLGFVWLDGPEIETDWFNFEALNHPPDHPARDAQDTFYTDCGGLLRTHTSPVQIRAMKRFRPPLKVIVPGRCFRNETVDASHEHTFYQMEGLVVDREVSVANLIHTMKTCLREILEREVKVRLRPGYFPFVEPGFELDVNCPFCEGSGCKVCKQSGWIEILPCGMVHPNVLRAGGIDPEEYSGFAFGMGMQRVAMLRYGINDIRLFMGGDLRFLQQIDET